MIHMQINGYGITSDDERVEIGESGAYERMMKSLAYYAENCQRVLVTVTIEDEYEGAE